MIYTIRHITRFRYSAPIRETMMEARMQPRSDGQQRCLEFRLAVVPQAGVSCYHDYLGNAVHHFDIPGQHQELTLVAKATVEMGPAAPLPEALAPATWDDLALLRLDGGLFDMLQPGLFTQPTPLLAGLAGELGLGQGPDPLTTLRQVNQGLYRAFAYAPQSTRVDSTVDEAIAQRRGVCQDFTHIMLALVRQMGIPGRYVSGYLYHRQENQDRSAEDATHAWMEAYLPELGWVGFDPTNNLVAGERHIRVAVGRDYADVPPTRGVFKGLASSELGVSVRVSPDPIPLDPEERLLLSTVTAAPTRLPRRGRDQQQQQQQ
jgi:transglutaminase-like putative cysteine protease